MARNFSSLLVKVLAVWHHLNQKEIGAAAGIPEKRVSAILRREMTDEETAMLLAASGARPAEVPIVQACLESLQALEQPSDLSEEERAVIEQAALGSARLTREGLTEAVRLSRPVATRGYPEPGSLAPARRRAAELLERLKPRTHELRLADVQVGEEYQTWFVCEACCEESIREASREVESAVSWAELALEVAQRVQGVPEAFCKRLLGYAVAHRANILKVAGELQVAEITLEEAKKLWLAGSDSDGVLDPGRLLHFEASLCREQRRFKEALDLHDRAGALSYPERALVGKAVTLEALGDYERAIEALLQAGPRVNRHADPRLYYMMLFNLAVDYTFVGRYRDAADLLEQVQAAATELGDEMSLARVVWLEGRIAAGLGRRREALEALEKARREFASHDLAFEVAQALLEELALLLEEGRKEEVKALAPELAEVFQCKGIHREALAALRLFHEAIESQEATAELARSVLRFLFRARNDQGLRFKAS